MWGVLYAVSESDLKRLDALEGVDLGYYKRIPVVVTLVKEGQAIREEVAETYVANHKGRNSTGTPPAQAYLDRYLEGGRHWGLPRAWLAHLEDLASDAHTTLVQGQA